MYSGISFEFMYTYQMDKHCYVVLDTSADWIFLDNFWFWYWNDGRLPPCLTVQAAVCPEKEWGVSVPLRNHPRLFRGRVSKTECCSEKQFSPKLGGTGWPKKVQDKAVTSPLCTSFHSAGRGRENDTNWKNVKLFEKITWYHIFHAGIRCDIIKL